MDAGLCIGMVDQDRHWEGLFFPCPEAAQIPPVSSLVAVFGCMMLHVLRYLLPFIANNVRDQRLQMCDLPG